MLESISTASMTTRCCCIALTTRPLSDKAPPPPAFAEVSFLKGKVMMMVIVQMQRIDR